jgi:hypothetical protein
MGILDDLRNAKKNASVQNAKKESLSSARTFVNKPAKQFFDNAPKPSDILLRKTEPRIINNATFDERPKGIVEQNIPFSKPRSAQQIIEANLGKDFFKVNKQIAVEKTQKLDKKQVRSNSPLSELFNNIFGGFFK